MVPRGSTLAADLPPYDPQRLISVTFPERVRLACVTWANESPNLPIVMALYWFKYLGFLIGGGAIWCQLNADNPSFTSVGTWHSPTTPSRRRSCGRSSGSCRDSAAAGAR
jgi:hypothetical protein